jgi:hypothetical protein
VDITACAIILMQQTEVFSQLQLRVYWCKVFFLHGYMFRLVASHLQAQEINDSSKQSNSYTCKMSSWLRDPVGLYISGYAKNLTE